MKTHEDPTISSNLNIFNLGKWSNFLTALYLLHFRAPKPVAIDVAIRSDGATEVLKKKRKKRSKKKKVVVKDKDDESSDSDSDDDIMEAVMAAAPKKKDVPKTSIGETPNFEI